MKIPEGSKLVPLPPKAGHIVSMCIFREQLYVAFQFGVYRKNTDDSWEQILAIGHGIAHEACYP